jgi:hypothetical protein
MLRINYCTGEICMWHDSGISAEQNASEEFTLLHCCGNGAMSYLFC